MRERRMQNGPHCESFYGAAAAAQCDSLSRIRTFASPCQSRAGAAGRHTRTQLHRARRQRSSWSALFSGPDCVRSARSASCRCNRSSSNWPFWPLSHSLCLCKCLPISCGSGKEEDESTVVCAFVLEKTAFQPGRLPFIRAHCGVTQALAFASGSLAVGSPLQWAETRLSQCAIVPSFSLAFGSQCLCWGLSLCLGARRCRRRQRCRHRCSQNGQSEFSFAGPMESAFSIGCPLLFANYCAHPGLFKWDTAN